MIIEDNDMLTITLPAPHVIGSGFEIIIKCDKRKEIIIKQSPVIISALKEE